MKILIPRNERDCQIFTQPTKTKHYVDCSLGELDLPGKTKQAILCGLAAQTKTPDDKNRTEWKHSITNSAIYWSIILQMEVCRLSSAFHPKKATHYNV